MYYYTNAFASEQLLCTTLHFGLEVKWAPPTELLNLPPKQAHYIDLKTLLVEKAR